MHAERRRAECKQTAKWEDQGREQKDNRDKDSAVCMVLFGCCSVVSVPCIIRVEVDLDHVDDGVAAPLAVLAGVVEVVQGLVRVVLEPGDQALAVAQTRREARLGVGPLR